MPGSKARSSTVVGGGGRGEGRGGRGSSWRGEGAASGRKRTVFRDDAVSSTDFNFPRSKQRERERDPFIYTRVGIRRAATRFILYHIERGEGGKDCVNDDERKRESEREKKRDF